MSKHIYKSLDKLLSSGYPGTLVVPWDYFFSTEIYKKKIFFLHI